MGNKLVTAMQGLLSTSGTASPQRHNIDASKTKEPLFELLYMQGKGLGLFAARSIARGTRIIEESPLLTMPRRQGQELTATDLSNALRDLDREQQDKFFKLHHNRDALVERLSIQQPQLLIDLTRGHLVDAAAIFVGNCVEMPEFHTKRAGVFEHYSRINHACNPNVHNTYNPTLGKLTVQAIQQINKGEEILTSYIDGTCSTRQQHQQVLSNWDFYCGCRTCTGPKAAASDERRRRMYNMYQQLTLYAAGQKPVPELPVLSDSQAALQVAEGLLELYKSEGITDLNLAEIYHECSNHSLQSGQFDKAVNYAKKERDIVRYCIGTGSLPLEDGIDGADIWLENVMSKRAEHTAQRKATENERMARETEMAQPKKKGGKGKKKK